jgi:hypothetical protein
MNLKIKSVQSFGCTHRVRMYVYVFIGVSAHTYMSIYIYTVFLKKILLCLLFCQVICSMSTVETIAANSKALRPVLKYLLLKENLFCVSEVWWLHSTRHPDSQG